MRIPRFIRRVSNSKPTQIQLLSNLIKPIIVLTFIFNMSQSFALEPTLLFYDKTQNPKSNLPKNFRDLSHLQINAIASGEFSENQLKEVRQTYPNDKIIVVDLRRESHGLINGEAVSWRAPFDQTNNNKSPQEIMAEEKMLLNAAKQGQKIIINQILSKEPVNGWYLEISPKIVEIKTIDTEKSLVEKFGFEYKRFAVRDYSAPNAKQLEEMVKFIKTLPSNKKLYVHCAGGEGRTTNFLVLFDIIKNGKKTSLKEILNRQAKLNGAQLDEFAKKEEWRKQLATERLKSIEQFYQTEIIN